MKLKSVNDLIIENKQMYANEQRNQSLSVVWVGIRCCWI